MRDTGSQLAYRLQLLSLDQLAFQHFSFGDVLKGHNRSDDRLVLAHWGGDVLDREAPPVLSPEELVFDSLGRALAKRSANGTLLLRVRLQVGFRVMDKRMKRFSDHFFGCPTDKPFYGRIDESHFALFVQTDNSFSGRIEDQFIAGVKPLKFLLGHLLLTKAFLVLFDGVGQALGIAGPQGFLSGL